MDSSNTKLIFNEFYLFFSFLLEVNLVIINKLQLRIIEVGIVVRLFDVFHIISGFFQEVFGFFVKLDEQLKLVCITLYYV